MITWGSMDTKRNDNGAAGIVLALGLLVGGLIGMAYAKPAPLPPVIEQHYTQREDKRVRLGT
jgi:hypothetical protein